MKYIIEIDLDHHNISISLNLDNEQKALEIGKNKIQELLNNTDKNNEIDYTFSITELLDENYNQSNNKLYYLLLYNSGGKKSYYDYNGNLINIEKLNSDYFNSFSFKSILGYNCNKFKVGDKVRFRYDNNKCIGKIIYKYESEYENIYKSPDPIHFKEGYTVEWNLTEDYTIFNEAWQEPYFDEDLELIKN